MPSCFAPRGAYLTQVVCTNFNFFRINAGWNIGIALCHVVPMKSIHMLPTTNYCKESMQNADHRVGFSLFKKSDSSPSSLFGWIPIGFLSPSSAVFNYSSHSLSPPVVYVHYQRVKWMVDWTDKTYSMDMICPEFFEFFSWQPSGRSHDGALHILLFFFFYNGARAPVPLIYIAKSNQNSYVITAVGERKIKTHTHTQDSAENQVEK